MKALKFMLEEYEKKRQKQVSWMRAILDYGMGVLLMFLGALMAFHESFNLKFNQRLSPGTVEVLGIIFMVYGAWRIYRGYKKNYFK